MLLEFSLKNFLSFKEKVTLSMVASNIKGHEEDNVFNLNNIKMLRSAVIYGANASGKSNLLKSMSFMKRIVLLSAKESQSNEEISIDEFKFSDKTVGKPSEFEVIFVHEGIPYRYGFVLDKKKIHKEWLYYVPNTKEAKLFERDDKNISLGTYFSEGKGLEGKTRNNALFLSVVDQFNGEKSKKIMEWFADKFNIISGLSDKGYKSYTVDKLENDNYKSEIVNFMKKADVGIEDIDTVEIKEEDLPGKLPNTVKKYLLDDNKIVITRHSVYNDSGEIVSYRHLDMDSDESEGTKKLFSLSGPIIETLQQGETIVIDELDAKLHPLIIRFIIGLFNSKETNPKNAQLIFATHDTKILSNRFFRRDQIWFVEKDEYASSDLYSLDEYKLDEEKKVRLDASFEKDYIEGKYGAIPFVGDFKINLFDGEADGD